MSFFIDMRADLYFRDNDFFIVRIGEVIDLRTDLGFLTKWRKFQNEVKKAPRRY